MPGGGGAIEAVQMPRLDLESRYGGIERSWARVTTPSRTLWGPRGPDLRTVRPRAFAQLIAREHRDAVGRRASEGIDSHRRRAGNDYPVRLSGIDR